MTFQKSFARVFICVVGVVLIGMIFRYFFMQPIINRFINADLIEKFDYLELDSHLGWRNKPLFHGLWPRSGDFSRYQVVYRIDKEGCRVDQDRSAASEPQKPSKLVWVLGDSSSFGLGVEAREIFSEKLGRNFKEYGILIKNFSVVGYNSRQVRKLFERKLESSLQTPDLIIVHCGFNDAPYTHNFFWKTPLYHPLHLLGYQYQISRIIKICQKRRIGLIFNTIPSLEDYAPLKPINHWLRSREGRFPNVEAADIQREFAKNQRRDLYAPLDDKLAIRFHPSAKGHTIIYEMLREKVGVLLGTNLQENTVDAV